ncbi:MAG: hypothetical protein AAF330_06185, partial [Pseudomonadota bacterium]
GSVQLHVFVQTELLMLEVCIALRNEIACESAPKMIGNVKACSVRGSGNWSRPWPEEIRPADTIAELTRAAATPTMPARRGMP